MLSKLLEIFGISNISYIDQHINNLVANTNGLRIFLEYFKEWNRLEDNSESLKYIVTCEYILLLKMDYRQIFKLTKDEFGEFMCVLDHLIKNGIPRYQKNVFRAIEYYIVNIEEQLLNFDYLLELIKYPEFEKHLIDIDLSNVLEFQNKRFLGRLLSLKTTNAEQFSSNLTILNECRDRQAKMRVYIFDIFTGIYNRYPDRLYNLLLSIVKLNEPKAKLTVEPFYTDYLNSYHFLENCLSVVFKINELDNEPKDNMFIYSEECPFYKRSSKPIGANSLTIPTKYSISTKFYFLIFAYYRVLFYSLIIQIYNCFVQMNLGISENVKNQYREYIRLNSLYLCQPYNETRMTMYMYNLVESFDKDILNEDILYEIIYYYSFTLEYNKQFSKSNLDYIPIPFFKFIIRDNEIFKNPHIKLRCVKILYLYNFSYRELDLGVNFLDSLISLSKQVSKMPGLEMMDEQFFYQSNIIKLLTTKNYISVDKDFYIIIFNQFESVLQKRISDIKLSLLNPQTSNAHILQTLYQSIKIYMERMENLILYIVRAIESTTSPFTEKDVDLVYHFSKFLYCIFKNLYDKQSSIIKINYSPTDMTANFWKLFVEFILNYLSSHFGKILEIPNMVKIINTYYTDTEIYIKEFDREYSTNYIETYTYLRSKIEEEVFPDNLPNEFLDPLLYTPIREPVVLPDSNIIVDRAVIMAHLLENHYDPFNRQPLDKDKLLEYNDKIEIKEKCLEFIKKREEWIFLNKV